MTDKKSLKLEDMNAAEYRRHLQQQSAELRSAAIKATGDVQATVEAAPEANKAKAKEVMEAPIVPLADERRVSAPEVGNIEPTVGIVPGKSTADTNPPQAKATTVSDDQSKK